MAWVETIRRIVPAWSPKLAELDAPFRGLARSPAAVTILVGNQGGDDGFAWDPDIVAMDLGALQIAYGDPIENKPDDAICRLLSHEYTHLLIHPWLDRCGWSIGPILSNPFLGALRTLFNEGFAGLRSIEDPRWVSRSGNLTSLARETLATLQPRMVERLNALAANPPPVVARDLLRNISQGKLTNKWGSIPIALWLAQATSFDPGKLRHYLARKPDRILDLAAERADPPFRKAFMELRKHGEVQIDYVRKLQRGQS